MYSCKFCDFHERHPQHFKEHCAKTHHYCEDCDIQFGSSYAMDDHWMHAHGRASLAVKVILKELIKLLQICQNGRKQLMRKAKEMVLSKNM